MDIAKLKESFATAKKQYEEVKGYGADTKTAENDHMYSMMSNLYNYISAVESAVYNVMANHNQNSTHLPKLTASQMEKMLDMCGAGKDYNIVKPTIFASKNNTFIAEYKK